jgi:hypothetical protein
MTLPIFLKIFLSPRKFFPKNFKVDFFCQKSMENVLK